MPRQHSNQTRRRRGGSLTRLQRGLQRGVICTIINGMRRCFTKKNNNTNTSYYSNNGYGPYSITNSMASNSLPPPNNGLQRSSRIAGQKRKP